MSAITHLLDHTANVWRRNETARGTMGQIKPSYDLIYTNLPCATDGQGTVLSTSGQGVVVAGSRDLYFDVGPVLTKRDLIEVHSGPTAPFIVEVRSWDPFRGHHLEVSGDEFTGVLQTPRITTASPLSPAIKDTPYTVTLEAEGGDGVYSWSVTAGTLPPGLSLNASTGVLSGTTLASGTYSFTVQVLSAGRTDEKDFAITIQTGVLGSFSLDFSNDFDVGGI